MTVHATLQFRFLGELNSETHMATAAQQQWVSIIQDILEEALMLPIFALLGSTLGHRGKTVNKVRTGFLVSFAVLTPIYIGLWAAAPVAVRLMEQGQEFHAATIPFVRIEIMSRLIASLGRYFRVVLTTADAWAPLYAIAVTRTGVQVLCDIFLWSSLSVSFKLGSLGIAWGHVIVHSTVLLLSLMLAYHAIGVCSADMSPPWRWDYGWLRNWVALGTSSGANSMVSNLCYTLLILRLVNKMGGQGTYFASYGFSRGWLMLPFKPLNEVAKQQVASRHAPNTMREYDGKSPPKGENRDDDDGKHGVRITPYLKFAACILVLWIVLIPAYEWWFREVYQSSEAREIRSKTLMLMPVLAVLVLTQLVYSVSSTLEKSLLPLISPKKT